MVVGLCRAGGVLSHSRTVMPDVSCRGGQDGVGAHQLCFQNGCFDHREQAPLDVRPDRPAEIPERPLGGYQESALVQPVVRVLDQFVERERFGRILPHPGFQSGPLVGADRRQAEVFAGPDLMFVLCLVALVQRAQRGDRWCG